MKVSKTTFEHDAKVIAAEFRDYAYSVSHDLSSPIRAMVEFSKLLKGEHEALLNEDAREYLSLIVENGIRLQAMMDGLLQYSRLNTMAKPFGTVSAERILQDCQLALSKQFALSKAVLEMGNLPTLHVDIEQLMQLFYVLLDNAIKFQLVGNVPKIYIAAEEKDGFWHFAITDNGIGIAPQYQEKIFKLFSRLHTDDEYSGVGIGLTLAQKIIQRHGGDIWLDSTVGEGSTFYFSLPIV